MFRNAVKWEKAGGYGEGFNKEDHGLHPIGKFGEYRGKENLRDRVGRLRSGLSPVSKVLPRVVHTISNIMLDEAGQGSGTIASSFVSHAYSPRTDQVSVHFGQYEHGVILVDGQWRIERKIIRLANDLIPTVLDVNAI